MLNTPNNQPESSVTSNEQTLTSRILNGITSSKTLIAAAIALASVTGCKEQKPEAPAKPAVTSSVLDVVTPYAVTGEGKKPSKLSANEFLDKWCDESRESFPNEMGPNSQFATTEDGTVVQLCARGGAKEVKSCKGKNNVYAETQAGNFAVASNMVPNNTYAKLSDKVPTAANGITDQPTYEKLDGAVASLPANARVADGYRVKYADCVDGQGQDGARVAKAEKAKDDAREKRQDERLTSVERRLGGVETAVSSLGRSMERFAASHSDKHGVCTSYAETPTECELLERTAAAHQTDEEKAKQ